VEACAYQSATIGATDATYTMGIFIDDDSTPLRTQLDTVMENQSNVCKTQRADHGPMVLKKRWDAKAAFGGNIMDNDNLQGDVTMNPPEYQAYIVYLGVPNGAPNVDISGMVTIYYDVVWDELKQPVGS